VGSTIRQAAHTHRIILKGDPMTPGWEKQLVQSFDHRAALIGSCRLYSQPGLAERGFAIHQTTVPKMASKSGTMMVSNPTGYAISAREQLQALSFIHGGGRPFPGDGLFGHVCKHVNSPSLDLITAPFDMYVLEVCSFSNVFVRDERCPWIIPYRVYGRLPYEWERVIESKEETFAALDELMGSCAAPALIVPPYVLDEFTTDVARKRQGKLDLVLEWYETRRQRYPVEVVDLDGFIREYGECAAMRSTLHFEKAFQADWFCKLFELVQARLGEKT